MEKIITVLRGTYIQVKTMHMLLDWFSNEQPVNVSLNLEDNSITCEITSGNDMNEINRMWVDVQNVMNEWVVGAIATGYAREHKWIE